MRRQLLAATALLLAGAACSSILGIDFPPLRDDGRDAGDGGPAVAIDSGPDHAFFSGFENGGFGEWIAPEGYNNPVLYNFGDPPQNELKVVPGGTLESANSLLARAQFGSTTKAAILIHRVPTTAFGDIAKVEGVRLELSVKLETLAIESGGPIEDAGASLMGGLLNAPLMGDIGQLFGPTLLLTNQDLYVAVVSNLFNGGQTSQLAQVNVAVPGVTPAVSLARFVNGSWLVASLYSGSRERARALNYPCEPNPEKPWVFGASIGLHRICLDAPELDITSLSNATTVAIGPILKGAGTVALRYDNVTVDVLSKP